MTVRWGSTQRAKSLAVARSVMSRPPEISVSMTSLRPEGATWFSRPPDPREIGPGSGGQDGEAGAGGGPQDAGEGADDEPLGGSGVLLVAQLGVATEALDREHDRQPGTPARDQGGEDRRALQ